VIIKWIKKEFKRIKRIFSNEVDTEIPVVGNDVSFDYLMESDMKIHRMEFMRIRRNNEQQNCWESVPPYEVIDGNLCVRCKSDIPHMTGWIVITKDEIMKLFNLIQREEDF